MNDFVGIVQWSTTSILLFLSGFELAAQVVNHNMTWSQIDWSLVFVYWTVSFLIYQLGKRLTTKKQTNQRHKLS